MKRLSVAIWLALFLALPASAQYKWVDSSGLVHYSDKPPPGNIKTERLRPPPQPASTPAADDAKGETEKGAAKAGPMTAAEQEQAFRKRQADAAKEQERQAKKEAEARERAENCKRAKAAVANLELGGRQTRVNEKGERVFLTDQQINQETTRAQREADAACN